MIPSVSHKGGLRLAAAALVAASAPQLHAVITAADSFATGGPPNYTTGDLFGQNPSRPGFSGAWLAAYGGAQSPTVGTGGLSYSDGNFSMNVTGGSISYPGGGNGRGGRVLTNAYDDATEGSVYFAVLIQLADGASPSYRGFELHNGGFDDGGNRVLQIVCGEPGVGASDSNFVVRAFNNAGISADLGPGDTDVNLFVGKISFSTENNGDVISIWRNPSDLSSEAVSGTPDAELSGFNFSFDRTSVARFNDNSDSGITFDEIRLGSAWSDVTTVASTTDTDADGLPDLWEEVIIDDAAANSEVLTLEDIKGPLNAPDTSDYDEDGSTDAGEFADGTDPLNPDTDGDGLQDGPEAVANTNPFLPDTDGDYLSDGREVLEVGSDPLVADSDMDDVNDGTEVASGTNPQNGSEKPAPGNTTVVGLELFDYAQSSFDGLAGGEFFDYDNSVANDPFVGHTSSSSAWKTSFGTEIVCGQAQTLNGSTAIRALNGPLGGGEVTGILDNSGDTVATNLYVKVNLTRGPDTTWSGITFMAGGGENTYAGVPGDLVDGAYSFGVSEVGEDNTNLVGVEPVPGQTYCLVAKVDIAGELVALFVDPDLDADEPDFGDSEVFLNNSENSVVSAIRLASGGSDPALWDDLVVATTWEGLRIEPSDSDGDGLRDTWEEAYSPGDPDLLSGAGNNDADSLINSAEQDQGSNPLVEDTDGDTLSDSDEVANGTNPCLIDSDRDGLADNVETDNGDNSYNGPDDTGTDPVNRDSDGDGDGDGQEVAQGSDPTDATSNAASLGLILVDGTRDDAYGDPIAVQTVQTQFGDNQSELNAAYAGIQDGKLFLMLTGNLEDNFNKLEIFIDSTAGGSEILTAVPGNDDSDAMDGLIFDNGFAPDFHVIIRRGSADGDRFDVNFANLNSSLFDEYLFVLGTAVEGSGETPAGTVNRSPIGVAYDNSNTAGVAGGTQAADQTAAAAVTTGLELCLDLADLGSPVGDIRVAAMVNSADHSFLSNQVLGGLPAPQGNLGSSSAVDFTSFDGDQFFTVTVPPQSDLRITSVERISGGSQLQFVVEGLLDGSSYAILESTTLVGFSAATGVSQPAQVFTASGTTQTVIVDIDPQNVPARFFVVDETP